MSKKKTNKIKTKICKQCNIEKNINEFRKDSRTKDGYISICRNCIDKNTIKTRKNNNHIHYYVYRFLDKDNNIIYVGKTINIHSRMSNHINVSNSLRQNENQFLMYQNLYTIEYSEVESDYHMNIYEIHYICKYNPLFNVDYKSNNKHLFDLPELVWKPYIFNSYLKLIQHYYLIKNGKDAINVKKEFKNNINFYNEIIKDYLESNFIYEQFNRDVYLDMYGYTDENILKDNDLDYCKNDCYEDDEICENCINKITWREYYNDKIKESKLDAVDYNKEDIIIGETSPSEICL